MRKVYNNFSSEIFPGFYNSTLVWTENYDCEISRKFSGEWFFTFKNWAEYKKAVAREWVEQMQNELNEKLNPVGLKTGLASVWSPKEYNFYTDRLEINVSFDLRKLKKFCFTEKRAEFDSYLRKNWTDSNGFWSFFPNNACWFTEQYKDGKDKGSLIDIMLEFYLLQSVDFYTVDCSVNENLSEIQQPFLAMENNNSSKLYNFEYVDDGYIPTEAIA